MPAVIVPPRAGVLSAAGILAAPVARELVRTWPTPASQDGLRAFAQRLANEARAWVGADAAVDVAFDCRYPGQSHEITVASVDDFASTHLRINGHVRAGDAVEVVAVRARAAIESPVAVLNLPVPERSGGVGPLVIAEAECTIWMPEGWTASVGEAGALVMRRSA